LKNKKGRETLTISRPFAFKNEKIGVHQSVIEYYQFLCFGRIKPVGLRERYNEKIGARGGASNPTHRGSDPYVPRLKAGKTPVFPNPFPRFSSQ
jgi:hypothetical protein